MIKILLYLLYLGHILGDFYFLLEDRSENREHLSKRFFIYGGSLLICAMPVMNIPIFASVLTVTISRQVLFCIKCKLEEKFPLLGIKSKIFFFDQISQLLMIALGVYFVWRTTDPVGFLIPMDHIVSATNFEWALSWILIILVICKPVSTMVKIILAPYLPEIKKDDLGIPNAGALIGMLERVFILMMVSANQYSAIGFVLTAKSIARYKRISDDPKFSEYYLLGTLLSSLSVIILYHTIF